MPENQENTLEPAIAAHLRVERTIPASTPPNYIPPFPAYGVKYKEDVAGLTMAIIGAQFPARDKEKERAVVAKVNSFLTASTGTAEIRPAFSEWAAVTDGWGFYNLTAIAYWKGHTVFETWRRESGFESWWQDLEPETQQHGWFLESFSPSIDRFESAFTDPQVPEGSAHFREGFTGTIKEHAYWGSMRDRMPASQTDHLHGEKSELRPRGKGPRPSPLLKRIRLPGKKNMALIRSGQDWKSTPPVEREMYLSTMEPVLKKGMNFLRDQGDELGCYSCRYMAIVNPVTLEADDDRTFGLAYFDELKSLEKWSKEHPTHLAIFGGFLKYVAKLNTDIKVRLFHEVMVPDLEQQVYEYIACHPETGMLTAASREEIAQEQQTSLLWDPLGTLKKLFLQSWRSVQTGA